MQFFFAPILFLLLIEIAGFVLIGGEIGLGMTFLWLIAGTFLGFYLLLLHLYQLQFLDQYQALNHQSWQSLHLNMLNLLRKID